VMHAMWSSRYHKVWGVTRGSLGYQGESQASNQPAGQVIPNPSSVVYKFL